MRLRRLIPLAITIAVLAAACGGDDRSVLATVDGEDITVEEFEIAMAQHRATTGVTDLVRLDSGESATILTNLIAVEAVRGPMAALGVEFPILLGSGDANEQRIIGEALTATADVLLGISGPDDEESVVAASLLDMDPLDRPVCASHILSPTVADSEAIVGRLEAGESFEDLAIELSTDPGSGAAGGSLGCRAPTEYVLEFAGALVTLDVDEVSGPVESQFGSHIIKRTPDTSDINVPVLLEARNTAINDWIATTFENADVELDPVIGVWTGTGIQPASAAADS